MKDRRWAWYAAGGAVAVAGIVVWRWQVKRRRARGNRGADAPPVAESANNVVPFPARSAS